MRKSMLDNTILGIELLNWILLILIIFFIIIIIRNVSVLFKRRNEYMSMKEAREQYAREHGENAPSDENGVDVQPDDANEEQKTEN